MASFIGMVGSIRKIQVRGFPLNMCTRLHGDSNNNVDFLGADLAMKIRNASQGWEPPFFITVYGGLTWTAAGLKPKEEFWFMLQRTMDVLGSDYVAVGANEMARLASSACTSSTPPPPPPPLTCSISVEQEACTPIPGQPWKNSTEVACLHLGCCWHEHGVKPSGHTCVKPESSGTPYTCAKPRASIMG